MMLRFTVFLFVNWIRKYGRQKSRDYNWGEWVTCPIYARMRNTHFIFVRENEFFGEGKNVMHGREVKVLVGSDGATIEYLRDTQHTDGATIAVSISGIKKRNEVSETMTWEGRD